jgi:hypothetical protein
LTTNRACLIVTPNPRDVRPAGAKQQTVYASKAAACGWVFLRIAGVQFIRRVGECSNRRRIQSRANNVVFALAVQADGRILVGGAFTNLAGQVHTHIGRVNADGSPHSLFTSSAAGFEVPCLGIQEDGKIFVGGSFANLVRPGLHKPRPPQYQWFGGPGIESGRKQQCLLPRRPRRF